MTNRNSFEKWAREAFECSEYSFAQALQYGYINTVRSKTFGGRVQPNYADVQMLWLAFQAGAAAKSALVPQTSCLQRGGTDGA